MIDGPPLRDFDVRHVFRSAIWVGRSRLKESVTVSLLVLLVSGFLFLGLETLGYRLFESGGFWINAITIGSLLANVFVFVFLNVVLVQVFVRKLWRQDLSFEVSFQLAWQRIIPAFVAALLMTVGFLAGFVLLIIPGFILYCGWFVTLPVVAGEGLGAARAMARSWALTKGYKTSLFALICVEILASFVLEIPFILSSEMAVSPDEMGGLSPLISVIFLAVQGTLSVIVSSALMATAYVELLRVRGEYDPVENIMPDTNGLAR